MKEIMEFVESRLLNIYQFDFEGYTITVTLPKVFFGEELVERGNMHSHSGYEIHFVSSGRMQVYTGEEEIEAGKWEYVIIPPGVSHLAISHNKPESKRCRFRLNFEKKAESNKRIDKSRENDVISKFVNGRHRSYILGYSKNIFKCFEKIKLETASERLFSTQTVELYLKEIIIDILRNIYRSDSGKSTQVTTSDEKRAYIIDSYFTNSFLKNSASKNELAEMLCVSVRQLERIIMKLYGQSFKDKLTQFRMEQAKFLLSNTDYPVEEVASKSGFANATYFHRIFKEKTGHTPHKYRKINLQKLGKNHSQSCLY